MNKTIGRRICIVLGHCQSTYTYITPFNPYTRVKQVLGSYFSNEETETQGGQVICSKSHD